MSRLIFSGALVMCLAIAACASSEPVDLDDPEFVPPAREAQSDFLDVGEQAGVRWLGFVPNAQRNLPGLYSGLDQDARRRRFVAPHGSPDQVLFDFSLPRESKIWPVEWFGTTLVAIDLPGQPGFSVALARTPADAERIARARADTLSRRDGVAPERVKVERGSYATTVSLNGQVLFAYASRTLTGSTGAWEAIVEWAGRSPNGVEDGMLSILNGIGISREMALEGLPTHKVTSTTEQLEQGVLRFPGGTLTLPVGEGMQVRKVGGDSTVRIDAHGAEPWLLIRQLSATDAPGDLRARIRRDTTFSRRLDARQARFSAGYDPGHEVPMILWDYSAASVEYVLVGVISVGFEHLAIEVVSQGLRESEARRVALESARELLAGAKADPAGDPERMYRLVGWNVGTMGRDE